MRKKIVAGNWKMHKTLEEGIGLAIGVIQSIQAEADKEKLCILCPPFIHLTHVAELVKEKMHFEAGAQNCHWEEEGAYTGEISAAMVASTGVSYVIIGHSERREYFNESNEMLAAKVNTALANHMQVQGDSRTAGIAFDHRVVTTTDKRMRGKIVFTFVRPNGAGGDPLSFGTHAWVPELTSTAQVTRQGATVKETTVQPRSRHVNCLPILGMINVSGLEILRTRVESDTTITP